MRATRPFLRIVVRMTPKLQDFCQLLQARPGLQEEPVLQQQKELKPHRSKKLNHCQCHLLQVLQRRQGLQLLVWEMNLLLQLFQFMVSMSQRQLNMAQNKNTMGRWHKMREMQPLSR